MIAVRAWSRSRCRYEAWLGTPLKFIACDIRANFPENDPKTIEPIPLEVVEKLKFFSKARAAVSRRERRGEPASLWLGPLPAKAPQPV